MIILVQLYFWAPKIGTFCDTYTVQPTIPTKPLNKSWRSTVWSNLDCFNSIVAVHRAKMMETVSKYILLVGKIPTKQSIRCHSMKHLSLVQLQFQSSSDEHINVSHSHTHLYAFRWSNPAKTEAELFLSWCVAVWLLWLLKMYFVCWCWRHEWEPLMVKEMGSCP